MLTFCFNFFILIYYLKITNFCCKMFPKCPNLKIKWIEATSKYSIICSRHFAADSYQLMKKRRLLFSNAEPTLMLPTVVSNYVQFA